MNESYVLDVLQTKNPELGSQLLKKVKNSEILKKLSTFVVGIDSPYSSFSGVVDGKTVIYVSTPLMMDDIGDKRTVYLDLKNQVKSWSDDESSDLAFYNLAKKYLDVAGQVLFYDLIVKLNAELAEFVTKDSNEIVSNKYLMPPGSLVDHSAIFNF